VFTRPKPGMGRDEAPAAIGRMRRVIRSAIPVYLSGKPGQNVRNNGPVGYAFKLSV
jgi:hypothetical protein